jgi:plasmid stabilization system protein ParE
VKSVTWHPDAIAAVKAAVDFGAPRWPSEAAELVSHVVVAVEQLQLFPLSGQEGSVAGTRELLLSKYPLMVVYAVSAGSVEVLDVVHQRQQWPVT